VGDPTRPLIVPREVSGISISGPASCAQFPDIVHQRRTAKLPLVFVAHAEVPGDLDCRRSYALGVLVGEWRLCVDNVGKSETNAVNRLAIRASVCDEIYGRKEQRQQHAQSVRAREEARTNASIVLTVSS